MRALLVIAALLPAGCGISYAWDMKGAPKSAPDEQYVIGTETRDYYWVWHCHQGERIVISQHSTAMSGASAPQMVKGPCDGPLPSEKVNATRHPHRISEGMRWPGSPPAPPEPIDGSAND